MDSNENNENPPPPPNEAQGIERKNLFLFL
jgi:hypothetical protein